jgi:uncharacterized protein (TIGR04255 family)
MPGKKLNRAPLKEAIFELYWDLPLDATNFPVDPEFDIALGKFADQIKTSFPIHKRLFPPGNNFKIYPKPGHQFWTGELEWPVVQLGPGILSVNDTDKNYIWEGNFRPNVIKAIEILQSSYESELKFKKVRLFYLDAVDYDPKEIGLSEFVSRNLLTSIKTGYEIPGKQDGINIAQAFNIDDGSLFMINIQNGLNNASGGPSIIWTTSVEYNMPMKKEDLLPWLDKAHELTSNFFVKMLKPEFYASFD